MNEFLNKTSFYLHILNFILMLIGILLFIFNYKTIKKNSIYEKITLSLLFSSVLGIHGLSHLALEKIYGYNPIDIFNV